MTAAGRTSLSHFSARGILLKGNGRAEIAPQFRPIALFGLLAIFLGVKCYRFSRKERRNRKRQ